MTAFNNPELLNAMNATTPLDYETEHGGYRVVCGKWVKMDDTLHVTDTAGQPATLDPGDVVHQTGESEFTVLGGMEQ